MSQTASARTTVRRTLSEVPRGDHGGTTAEADGAVTEAGGALPDCVTVFDDQYPGVASLDPDLLQALS
jgi:hypothetical protein